MTKQIDTVIIGAGHSGLAISYFLTQKKIPHVVLERGKIAQRWRSNRWDSITMVIPNYYTQLPGFHYKGSNPQGFDTREQYVQYLEDYAQFFNAPVQTETSVQELTRDSDYFIVKTDKGVFKAKNVVIATGAFQKQKAPDYAKVFPKNIFQIPSTEYKNPQQIPKGAVLVVGSGNTGAQIAEELNKNGKKVFFSLGRFRKTPRRYRGKDMIYWFEKMGRLEQTVDSLPTPDAKKVLPIVFSGVGGGHEIDFYDLSEKGVTLIGRIEKVKNGKAHIAGDLVQNLEKGEEAYINFKKAADKYIEENNIDAPIEKIVEKEKPEIKVLQELDLKKENIACVIWATGFEYEFDWIKISKIFAQDGEPVHKRGVTPVKGLFFLGLPWLHKYKSFFIYGVGEDARYLSEQIT